MLRLLEELCVKGVGVNGDHYLSAARKMLPGTCVDAVLNRLIDRGDVAFVDFERIAPRASFAGPTRGA